MAVLVMSLQPPIVTGHDDVHKQIFEITLEIDAAPTDAMLFLRRGELYQLDEHWDEALSDFEQAAKLDPTLDDPHLSRAQVLLKLDQLQEALSSIDRFLLARTDHTTGHWVKARILARLGWNDDAAEEYTKTLAVLKPMERPSPDLYLERAHALAKEGRIVDAVRGLDEGIGRLGPLVQMELLAIELERAHQRMDSALARVDRIAQQSKRKETWLYMRGEILNEAGRLEDARQAFSQALVAIKTLPARLQGTRGMRELEERVQGALSPEEEVDRKSP